MRKIFTIIIIALFSISAVSAMLIVYDHLTSYHVMSRDRAIAIAMHSGGWTQQDLGISNANLNAQLLQAKLSNRVALIINPITMTENPYPIPLKMFNVQDDQLFWEVTIEKQVHPLEFQSWIYEIDAINGTVIQSFTPNG